jgi:hypothetical protein
LEKAERELRAISNALERVKGVSEEKKNQDFINRLVEMKKEYEEKVKLWKENEKRDEAAPEATDKLKETELEKDEKEIQLKENTRDPIHTLRDAQNQFYDDCKEAAVIGDTIGDPLKDTSGPSINILIKLSSIISVIFGGLFVKTAFLVPHTA